jgi:single-stranded DNA-binding protein
MSETERVTLVGNLTADPELRSTPSGLEVANLRIAVTPPDPTGGRQLEPGRDQLPHHHRVARPGHQRR